MGIASHKCKIINKTLSPRWSKSKCKDNQNPARVKVNLKELESNRAETPSRIGEFLGSKYGENEPIQINHERMYLSSRPLKTRSKSTRTHNVEDEQVFVARKLNSTLFNFNWKSDNPANSISRFTSRFGKIRQNQGKSDSILQQIFCNSKSSYVQI